MLWIQWRRLQAGEFDRQDVNCWSWADRCSTVGCSQSRSFTLRWARRASVGSTVGVDGGGCRVHRWKSVWLTRICRRLGRIGVVGPRRGSSPSFLLFGSLRAREFPVCAFEWTKWAIFFFSMLVRKLSGEEWEPLRSCDRGCPIVGEASRDVGSTVDLKCGCRSTY